MTKYLRIPADGTKEMEVVDLNGLDELRAGIGGGWLEGVNLPPTPDCPGARMYCDEEFQFKPQLGVNMRATMIAHGARIMPGPNAIIGGDVLLFDLDPHRGENDKPVSDGTVDWAKRIETVLKRIGEL